MSDRYLEPVQSRTTAPTPYELKLAGAIEEVFGSGRHDLPGLVAGLNELGIPAPDGATWDADMFLTVMESLEAER